MQKNEALNSSKAVISRGILRSQPVLRLSTSSDLASFVGLLTPFIPSFKKHEVFWRSRTIILALALFNCTLVVASTSPANNPSLENALAHTAKAINTTKEKASVYEALRATHQCLTMRLHNDLAASTVVKNDVDKAYEALQKAVLQESAAKKALLAVLEKDIVLNEKEFTVYAQ